MGKEEKMLEVCNAIAYYMMTQEEGKAIEIVSKLVEPSALRIAQLESELQMLQDYFINEGL